MSLPPWRRSWTAKSKPFALEMDTAMRSFVSIIIALIATLCGGAAHAQSPVGSPCPYIAYGSVLTAAQWQYCFEIKADATTGGYLPLAGGTMTGPLVTAPSATGGAGFNLAAGTAPTSPNNGDMWSTSAGFYGQAGGVTYGPFTEGTAGSFAATAPLAVTFPSSVVTYALAYNSSLTKDGSNNLGINLANTNVYSILQTIDLGTGTAPAAGPGAGFDLYGANGASARSEITAFTNGTSGVSAIFDGRTSLGTRASPSAVTSGTLLSSFEGKGYDTSVWTGTGGSVHVYAEGTFSPTSHPGEACLATTASGATATTDWLCVHNDGGATLGSPTGGDEGAGTLNLAGALYGNGTAPTGTGGYVRAISPTLVTPALAAAIATSINGLAITTTIGSTLDIANGKTLTDTSGVGADLLLGATGGGFTAYGGTSSAGNVLTALSAAGAGSFLPYGLTGNSTLVETTTGGLLTPSLLPAATSSVIGGVIVGTGLTVSSGTITPTFGTATNQVAEGGVITAAGPIGSATAIPVITYNAAGQLTTVGTATPTVASVNGVSYGSSPSINTVPVVTGTNATTYEAVPNAALANSAITLGGTSVSLGGTTGVSGTPISGLYLSSPNIATTINGSPTWPSPGVIGGTTPAAITGTTITGTASVTDSGLSTQGATCNSSAGLFSTTTTGCANFIQSLATGGTGAAISATQYGLPYFSSTTAMGSTAAGTTSTLFQGNASGPPTWVSTLPATVQGNITATGALASGSIASGFGAIVTSNTIATAAHTITSPSADALAVGPNGTTNPTLQVNASASSAATGLDIVGAAAGSGLALSVISSGTNENLTLNAKGSGTIGIGSVSTGAVTITPNTILGGTLTAASLAASGTAASSLCITSGGGVYTSVGVNCFANGSATAGGSNTQAQYNASGSLGGISGVTSNGTSMTFATGDLIINGGSATAGIATVTSGGVVSSEAVVPVANGGTAASASVAYSLFGNTANNTTGAGYFAIGGLTNKASPTGSDLILIQDQAASGQLKYASMSAVASVGVASIAGNTGAFTLSTGITNSTNVIQLALNNATLQAQPSNPTGTTTTSANVMMGLGGTCKITPVYSGRIFVQFMGDVANSVTGDSAFFTAHYGTGTAPVNAAAATGTVIGAQIGMTEPVGGDIIPFTVGGIVTGLTPSTAYWLDMGLQAFTGGTATLTNLSCNAMEF
jgi:hypothetical protein